MEANQSAREEAARRAFEQHQLTPLSRPTESPPLTTSEPGPDRVRVPLSIGDGGCGLVSFEEAATFARLATDEGGDIVVVRFSPVIVERDYPVCECSRTCGVPVENIREVAVLKAGETVAREIEVPYSVLHVRPRYVERCPPMP